jgi:DNA uptake protein ComE-like DNA-binding protein
MELRVRWEDESGKISLTKDGYVSKNNDTYKRLSNLFDIKGIDQAALERIADKNPKFTLVTELHQFLGDEEYSKVQDLLTAMSTTAVNVNTASADVLQSLGLDRSVAESIVERRSREPFAKIEDVKAFPGMTTMIAGVLGISSDVFKVQSYATVGGYTRQIEAVITRGGGKYTVNYWRAL